MDPIFSATPQHGLGSPSTEQHRKEAPRTVKVGVLTISDTRTKDNDRSGELIRQNLLWRGHEVTAYEIVPDEPSRIRDVLQGWIDDSAVEAIVTNGGTGIAGRDNTFDTISALLEKRLDGFGEIFRMLSFQEIGAAAMLSRAIAGIANDTAIFSTPGSSNAVKLAMERLIGPELGHVVHEITK